MANGIEDKVERHEEMLKKHDEEITDLKKMGEMFNERIKRLEGLMEESFKIENKLTEAMVQMAKSQNRMIWKIVVAISTLVGLLGVLVGYLHM